MKVENMRVICINTSRPHNWIFIEDEDYLEVGQTYNVEEIIENEDGTKAYYLKERPAHPSWRVQYAAHRFVIIPENGEIPEFKIIEEEYTEEEEFIRKMKVIGMSDESIQAWLDYLKRSKK